MGEIVFSSVLSSRAYDRIPWNLVSLDLLRFPKFSVLAFGVQEGVWCCMGMWSGICDPNLIKRNISIYWSIPHAGTSRIPQNHRTPASHRTAGVAGYSLHVTDIYYYFGSSSSIIFHTWPSSWLAFSPSPQWPLRPERLMKRLHSLSRNIIWETMAHSLRGLNTCSWTWQHVTREEARLTRVTELDFHHQRSIIIFQISGAIFAWNMISLGIWVRFC